MSKTPDGSVTKVIGRGTVKFTTESNKVIELRDALCVPDYKNNLLSVRTATERDVKFAFEPDRSFICMPGGDKIPVKISNGLYVINARFNENPKCASSQGQLDFTLWHQRLGHLNEADLQSTVPGKVSKHDEACEVCLHGKITRTTVPVESANKAEKPLERVASDVLGPLDTPSLQGHRYAVTFIDEYSKYAVAKFMTAKSEVPQKFKEFLAEVGVPQVVRSDNGTEYTSQIFRKICVENKIRQEFTVPETPEQNGMAERFNRTMTEMTRCLLIQSKLSKRYWVRAMSTAVTIRNMVSTRGRKSPCELMFGKEPKVRSLRVFGCSCFALKRQAKLSKLEPKSVKGKFIGYSDNSRAYIVQEFDSMKITFAKNVVFIENEIRPLGGMTVETPSFAEIQLSGGMNQQEGAVDTDSTIFTEDTAIVTEEDSAIVTERDTDEDSTVDTQADNPEAEVETDVPHRSTRERKLPVLFAEYWSHNAAAVREPSTHEEAMNSEEKAEWQQAMCEEIEALKANATWTLVPRSEATNVPGRWVFKRKTKADGSLDKYKARYVAKGFKQIEGLEFHKTFAPTAKPESLRTILALAAKSGAGLHQLDVKSAYLHSAIAEEVYLEQPQGFQEEGMVCRLNKSIYGLKQAARNWYEALSKFLEEENFKRSTMDYCLFIRKASDGAYTYVLSWVDDIILSTPSARISNELRNQFASCYKMDDRGQLSWFLGMRITQSQSGISLDQEQYIQTVLERFGMSECKAVHTPADMNLRDHIESGEEIDQRKYRGLVGALLHIGKYTRPDILNTVNVLSRYLHKPNESLWVAGKRVLRYLKGTSQLKLHYSKNQDPVLMGWADADWNGDPVDRRSTTGYLFKLDAESGAISWNVRKQPTVSLSSSEAEYQSMAAAVQEALYLRSLLDELGVPTAEPTFIGEENQSCIKMTENPVMSRRTKHVDSKFHFVRERVAGGTVKIYYVPTSEMAADLLTKPLARDKVEQHRGILLGAVSGMDARA